ncbi:MAG: hypothetical protein MI861_01720, partial [Pirellulales bacterium]|nr:hypothetical protein [Pirellulales bacterium]
ASSSRGHSHRPSLPSTARTTERFTAADEPFGLDDRDVFHATEASFSTAPDAPQFTAPSWLQIGVLAWLAWVGINVTSLSVKTLRLHLLRRRAVVVPDPSFHRDLGRLKHQMGLRQHVDLLSSEECCGPLAAGILRPFILIPAHQGWERPAAGTARADGAASRSTAATSAERDALLAHELAHLLHRDAAWNLIAQMIGRLFPFQPLNRLAARQLRKEMDFVADLSAARTLGERRGLAQCLIRLGDQLVASGSHRQTTFGLAVGMAAFRSTLGRRVEALLDPDDPLLPLTRFSKTAILTLTLSAAILISAVVPRAVAQRPNISTSNEPVTLPTRNESMKNPAPALALLAGLTHPVIAEQPQQGPAAPPPAAELKTTPDPLPAGIQRFNGMLLGRLASKDVEKGTFVVQVDAISRVWRNSRAEDPKSLVGKTVQVSGVFGKFLDVLVVMRKGETLEFECQHNGDGLTFPGELLRKVAPYRPEDYPVLPEEFRGFQGALAAKVMKKDPETFELIVKVDRVLDTWKANTAKQPRSIEGKSMMLAGFWQRKEMYHRLKVGDQIEVGTRHIERRSDHLTVAEFVRKTNADSQRAMKREGGVPVEEGTNTPLRGFRGMLVGRLIEKDVERGTFAVEVDAVPRVWRNNQASRPKSLIGTRVAAQRVPAKMLDTLVVARVGDTLEFGALHEGGEQVRVGEVLRKVAPVQPGDYPELPPDFRGFKGMIRGKIVKKDEHLLELILEVTAVEDTFDGSRAKRAQSIVGHKVMLTGFWRRKDTYHQLNVGDTIQCGVEHPQRLSDHLSVIESVRKVRQ